MTFDGALALGSKFKVQSSMKKIADTIEISTGPSIR
jgi:hypothetical protein